MALTPYQKTDSKGRVIEEIVRTPSGYEKRKYTYVTYRIGTKGDTETTRKPVDTVRYNASGVAVYRKEERWGGGKRGLGRTYKKETDYKTGTVKRHDRPKLEDRRDVRPSRKPVRLEEGRGEIKTRHMPMRKQAPVARPVPTARARSVTPSDEGTIIQRHRSTPEYYDPETKKFYASSTTKTVKPSVIKHPEPAPTTGFEKRVDKLVKREQKFFSSEGFKRIDQTASKLTFGGGVSAKDRGFIGGSAQMFVGGLMGFPIALGGALPNVGGKISATIEGVRKGQGKAVRQEHFRAGKETLKTTLNPTTKEGMATYATAFTFGAIAGGARARAKPFKALQKDVTAMQKGQVPYHGKVIAKHGQPTKTNVYMERFKVKEQVKTHKADIYEGRYSSAKTNVDVTITPKGVGQTFSLKSSPKHKIVVFQGTDAPKVKVTHMIGKKVVSQRYVKPAKTKSIEVDVKPPVKERTIIENRKVMNVKSKTLSRGTAKTDGMTVKGEAHTYTLQKSRVVKPYRKTTALFDETGKTIKVAKRTVRTEVKEGKPVVKVDKSHLPKKLIDMEHLQHKKSFYTQETYRQPRVKTSVLEAQTAEFRIIGRQIPRQQSTFNKMMQSKRATIGKLKPEVKTTHVGVRSTSPFDLTDAFKSVTSIRAGQVGGAYRFKAPIVGRVNTQYSSISVAKQKPFQRQKAPTKLDPVQKDIVRTDITPSVVTTPIQRLRQVQKQRTQQDLTSLTTTPTDTGLTTPNLIVPPPPIFMPFRFSGLGGAGGGYSFKSSFKIKKVRAYTPTIYSSFFGVKKKLSKKGKKKEALTGLSIRPLSI